MYTSGILFIFINVDVILVVKNYIDIILVIKLYVFFINDYNDNLKFFNIYIYRYVWWVCIYIFVIKGWFIGKK